MKPHARLRALSAVVGGLGVVGMGMVGMSLGARDAGPDTVVAPGTGQMTPGDNPDEMTTTNPNSFRPIVTATVPPPPIDND
jgi:hypothetical protein